MSTNPYPNLNTDEKNWLVEAARRPDANVDALIDSFLVLFPDRREHDGLTEKQIRETLKSRFNDILYRKDRGYAEQIAEKRNEYEQTFTSVFAVLNPIAQMNFYERIFTDPKSKPSDKFKAINDAEKLKARFFGESPKTSPAERAEALKTSEITTLRKKLFDIIDRKRYNAVRATLSDTLKEKIENRSKEEHFTKEEAQRIVLEEEGMHEAAEMMRKSFSDHRMKDMPPNALVALSDRLLHGRSDDLSIDEIDAIIDEILRLYV